MANSVEDSLSLTKKTIKGFSWTGLSSILQAILQLVVLSSLARLLDPRDFGLFGIALIFSTFAERIGKLGVGPALVQLEEISEDHIRSGLSLSVLLGLLMFAIIWLISPLAADFFFEPQLLSLLKAVGLIFVVDSLGTVSESMLQREMRFKELLIINNSAYIVGNGVVSISLAAMGWGVWSLVLGSLVGRIFKVVILFREFSIVPIIKMRRSVVSSLLALGVGFTISKICNYTALVGDNFIVGRVLGASPLGLYSRAYQIMTLPATYVGQVMEKVLFPAFAKKQSNKDRLSFVYLLGIECIGLLALPMSVFCYISAKEIVDVLLGSKWTEAIAVLEILSLGMYFRTAYKNSDTLITGLGAVYQHSLRQFVYTVFVLVGAYLGSYWGLSGVSWAVLLAVFVNFVLMSHLGHKLLHLNVRPFLMSHLPGLWISFWLGIVLYLVTYLVRIYEMNAFICLSVQICVSAVVCLISAILARGIFRPTFFDWSLKYLNLPSFGRPGRFVERMIAFQTSR